MRKFALALLIASCTLSAASAKVTTDADPAAAFGNYRTYYWAIKPEAASPLMQQRIVEGVDVIDSIDVGDRILRATVIE